MTKLDVSDDLVERIEARIEHTEFESADEYAAFVLDEVLTRVERGDDATGDTEPRKDVEGRLQSLGYLED